ncbi:MAG TPA: LutB/LldF family L-lactate oxidation iron-sulfur protein [Vicinamibacterales bacterium]|nr:LutB/LldF family L-lactate oxidation iron-sulfur protein [Vicinamibacterales bacterium]
MGGAARTRAADKAETLARLDHYAVEFERQVVARGGHVHWAATAEDARQHVLRIAAARGATRVVKSKSMVSEEVHLNTFLSRAGVTPIETDLGEYIIQLAGEAPSHIIAPALHKSRGDVARLFQEHLGLPYTEDVEQLTAEARRRLREEFCAAGLGVSGANFAVAETGTIVIVENEGNARLSTSVPRVHVALVGIEKLIPRVTDLAVFLTLLPRNATGQPMSSYVSFISGPRRRDELDGPDEVHVVLVDNGRTELLADAAAREALACIRCGACLNVCPVYRTIGGHAYGPVYAGPIGALVSPYLDPDSSPPDLPFVSSLCGACASVCPVKIDIPAVLVHLRARTMEGSLKVEPMPERRRWRFGMRLWAAAMRTSGGYRLAFALLRRGLKPFTHDGRIERLPGPFAGWTSVRDFPIPAEKSFRELWKHRPRS